MSLPINCEEIWKDVVGYEGKYQVSNLGRLRSRFKIRNPVKRKDGYWHAKLRIKGVEKVKLIHRLVAESFLIGRPDQLEVNHKDGDRANSNLSNLEWVTRGENAKHAFKFLGKSNRGEKNPRNKIPESEIKLLRTFKNNKASREFFSKRYGILPSSVTGIINRRTWKHV